ncbi:MAG: chalcone isomerase family protein [Piscinibacter sp.]|nr:chalcone isomerase family protein [Piscinibacter sp.]
MARRVAASRRAGSEPGRSGLATPGPGSPVVRPRPLLARRKHGAECSSGKPRAGEPPLAVTKCIARPRPLCDTARLCGPTGLPHDSRRRVVIRRTILAAAALLALAALPAQAQVTEVAGIKYEQAYQVGNTRLVLNGAGIRYKAVFKVYTAGLYLSAKASTTEAVLATPGPKRMHIVMLRDIDANELGKLFTRGMQDNSPREEFSKSIAGTLRMSDLFSAKKRLTAGENFSVEWVPGQGTTVLINGKPQGEPIREPEFFSALMKIWLGPSPADAQLKDVLLGKASSTRDPFAN